MPTTDSPRKMNPFLLENLLTSSPLGFMMHIYNFEHLLLFRVEHDFKTLPIRAVPIKYFKGEGLNSELFNNSNIL